jgi:hypothetical protein
VYELKILSQARKDMQHSADWYNEQQAGLGEHFLSEVIKTLRLTEINPLHYEEKFSKKFRFARLNIFPYVVVFKVKNNLIIINAVFHTSRNPKKFV